MRYINFEVGNNNYKLRLGANETTEVEKRLGGKNLLDMFFKVKSGTLPPLNEILIVLHGAMQKFNSNITIKNVYDIYDEYVEEGNGFLDLIGVLTEVMEISGFFGKVEKTPQQEN